MTLLKRRVGETAVLTTTMPLATQTRAEEANRTLASMDMGLRLLPLANGGSALWGGALSSKQWAALFGEAEIPDVIIQNPDNARLFEPETMAIDAVFIAQKPLTFIMNSEADAEALRHLLQAEFFGQQPERHLPDDVEALVSWLAKKYTVPLRNGKTDFSYFAPDAPKHEFILAQSIADYERAGAIKILVKDKLHPRRSRNLQTYEYEGLRWHENTRRAAAKYTDAGGSEQQVQLPTDRSKRLAEALTYMEYNYIATDAGPWHQAALQVGDEIIAQDDLAEFLEHNAIADTLFTHSSRKPADEIFDFVESHMLLFGDNPEEYLQLVEAAYLSQMDHFDNLQMPEDPEEFFMVIGSGDGKPNTIGQYTSSALFRVEGQIYVIDPPAEILTILGRHGINPLAVNVILTHLHSDHDPGVRRLAEWYDHVNADLPEASHPRLKVLTHPVIYENYIYRRSEYVRAQTELAAFPPEIITGFTDHMNLTISVVVQLADGELILWTSDRSGKNAPDDAPIPAHIRAQINYAHLPKTPDIVVGDVGDPKKNGVGVAHPTLEQFLTKFAHVPVRVPIHNDLGMIGESNQKQVGQPNPEDCPVYAGKS